MEGPFVRTVAIAAAIVWSATIVLGTSARADAEDEPRAPAPRVLDDEQLLRKYVWSTLGPEGMLHASLLATYEQLRDDPEEWSANTAGFGQRWVSTYAASAIGNTTKYAVAHFYHQDPSFTRCQCTGVAPRLRHAMTSPFMARTRDGRRVFSLATVAGLTAENVVPATTWYPAPHGMRDGIADAAASVVSKMTVSAVKEFLPRRQR
jgi:hypothetical protein